MISGVDSLVPLTHLAHPPPTPPPATLSLFSIFKSLLWFASLSVFILFLLPFLYVYLFWVLFIFYIYLFWGEYKWGRGGEGGRGSEVGSALTGWQQQAWCGALTHEPRDRHLSGSQRLNRLRHPGAPDHSSFNFWGTSVRFSIVVPPICIPTNSTQRSPFLHILTNVCYFLSSW